MNAIEIKNISKEINGQHILKDVSFNIKKGEIYGFLGQNGAGKSTLMKIMFDILKPTAGEVNIFGATTVSRSHSAFAQVSGIIEAPIFYNHLTAYENLDIHCDYMNNEQAKSRIDDILEMVGLDETVKKKKARDLSLGMKQRLALGRALLCQPEILILDEPINGLDPKGVLDMRELILKLKAQGITILISSHIIAEIEKIVDRIGIIHEGRFVEELTIKQIKTEKIDLEAHFINILKGGVA